MHSLNGKSNAIKNESSTASPPEMTGNGTSRLRTGTSAVHELPQRALSSHKGTIDSQRSICLEREC